MWKPSDDPDDTAHTNRPGARPSTARSDVADLIVVSTERPRRHEVADRRAVVDRSVKGPSEGTEAAARRFGGSWITPDEGPVDPHVGETGRAVTPFDTGRGRSGGVRADEEAGEAGNGAEGYIDRVLRPICRSSLSNVRARHGDWERYREMNETVADAVVGRASPGDVVLTSGRPFGRLPRLVDERAPGVFLAHFWDAPWPGWDTFRACPHAETVLRGLLGNDLFGVQVPRFRENFLGCVDAALPDARIDWHEGRVLYRDGVTTVGTFPLGVDTDRVRRGANDGRADHRWSRFATRNGIDEGARIAIAVDPLDEPRGILARLGAFEHLLETRPEWRGELVFVQVATASRRSDVAAEGRRAEIASAVDRLNDRFAEAGWRPVVYTTRHLSDGTLYSLYRHADVGVVNPIRGGMSRVAQEFVVAQSGDPGVLVLGDQGGTHDLLGEWAVSVSPGDTAGFASGLQSALSMPAAERRQRMAPLAGRTRELDVEAWTDDVFDRVGELRDAT